MPTVCIPPAEFAESIAWHCDIAIETTAISQVAPTTIYNFDIAIIPDSFAEGMKEFEAGLASDFE